MAEAALSTDHEEQEPETCCGYCMRPVEEMDQPKTLPCGHISCLPCVREDFHKLNGSIMCEKCKSTMGDIILYALPDHNDILEGVNAPTSTTEDHASRVQTTRCDACDKPANAYCLNCDKRMCIEHILPHDDFVEKVLKTKHEKVRAEDYEQYPGLYASPFCKQHPAHCLIEVCTECSELFCTRCDPREVCKKGANLLPSRKGHVLVEIAVFTNGCTEKLKSLTKKLSDTEAVFAQAEKKCWAELDSLEERMQSLKMEVKVKVEDLVRQIQEQGETIEEELTECLNVNTHALEEKAERLRNEREQLTAARTSLSDFTNRSRDVHIVRNVQYRVGDTEKLLAGSTEASKDVKLFSLFLSCGELGDMLKTSPQPHRLELLNTESYKALSAEWISPDRIGCISENNLCAVMNEKLAVISADTLDDMGKIESCIAAEKHFKVPVKDGYILMLWLKPTLLDDPSPLKTGFWISEEKIQGFASIGALYDQMCTLSSANDSTVTLTVSSSTTGKCLDVRLAGITSFWGLHMISRSEVIVSDETNGKLYKYSIPNRNPVWILDGLDSPLDITSDSAGLIYVASQNARKIYVVNSSTGHLMTELTHPDLNKVAAINTISISGNKLVMACGDSGILLFKIK